MDKVALNHKKLGYIEHTETLSVARYPEKTPNVPWHDLAKQWHEPPDTKNDNDNQQSDKIRVMIEGLWANFFICRDAASIGDSKPKTGFTRMGFIAYREDLLMINEISHKTEITIGDIFLTESDWNHDLSSKGLFVLGLKDIRNCNLPQVEKSRRLFLRDVETIRKYSKR